MKHNNYKYNLPLAYKDIPKREVKFVREQYIKQQGGLCFFCKNPLTEPPTEKVRSKRINLKLFPKGFLEKPVHLQHCHKTGLTEGAVHALCNAVLWQYYGR